MPRFAVLSHDWPSPHFDLLLEADAVLRAWRLASPPSLGANAAEANFDHRKFYLDYEGVVSGGRGTVTRWDAGTFELVEDAPGRVVVELRGTKLTGRVELNYLPTSGANPPGGVG
jgi:hypothetical protein